jgi:hypothetical protein
MMHHRQRKTSLLFVFLSGVLFLVFGARAQQQQASQQTTQSEKSTQSQQAKDDEPVAITEKSKPANSVVSKVITEDQFGNFRFPIINNKGEIAFIGIFKSTNKSKGFGQSIFIRLADGNWKVIPEGETATNLPEPIYGFSSPGFNDNGDLTYVANFGAVEDKPAPPLDPNDPAAYKVALKKQALFVRTANGRKMLAKLGEEVPNMPSIFSVMSNPSTNSKGTTAFIGTYSDPDGRGLFLVEEGKLRLIVRSGQKRVAGDDATFSEHYYPTPINERNEVAFLARVNDKSGIFVSRQSGIETIALVGNPSPIKGANYLGFGNRTPAINNKGEVAFVGFVDGPDAGRVLFFKGTGPAHVVARSGQTIQGSTYNFTDFHTPAVNSRGDLAFIGNFGGRSRGIFIKTAKGIEAVALTDQPVPGGAKEEVFNNFTQPSINERGEVVFYAQSKGPTIGIDVGIFLRDEKGKLKVIAKRGDKMPK